MNEEYGTFFYATSSFVHHFVAICEFQLELYSGKVQIGAKFALTSVTFTFDSWPFILSMVIISLCYDDSNIVKKVWHTNGRKGPFIELLGRS